MSLQILRFPKFISKISKIEKKNHHLSMFVKNFQNFQENFFNFDQIFIKNWEKNTLLNFKVSHFFVVFADREHVNDGVHLFFWKL